MPWEEAALKLKGLFWFKFRFIAHHGGEVKMAGGWGSWSNCICSHEKENDKLSPQLAFFHFGVAKTIYFIFIYVLYVYMHTYVCSAYGDQKGESDSLELVTFVSH